MDKKYFFPRRKKSEVKSPESPANWANRAPCRNSFSQSVIRQSRKGIRKESFESDTSRGLTLGMEEAFIG